MQAHFTDNRIIAGENYKLKQSDIEQFIFGQYLSGKMLLLDEVNNVANVMDAIQITYKANYTDSPSDVDFKFPKDVETALKANPFSRTGYTLIGWNTAEDSTGIDYSDGELVTLSAGTTLYAQWKERELVSIEITSEPKTSYTEGQSFDPTGMVVTAVYDNEETEEIAFSDLTISVNDPLTVDDEKVVIEYNGVTTELEIKVNSNDDGGTPVYDTSDALKDYENGEVKANFANPSAGVLVTLTVTPDKGYEVGEITITDENGKEIEVIDNGDGTYSYRQPASEIEIDVEFVEIEEVKEEEAKPEEKPEEEPKAEIILTIGNPNAIVNGETIINDVAPVIINGRTMLPIRFIVEELGGKIEWNDELKKVTITKGDLVIEIFIGSPFALVNNVPVELDSPAFIENGRTYLPVRFVADYLGADVEWIDETKTVIITEK